MNGKVYFKRMLIIWAICLLILTSIPITLGETSDSEITSPDDINSSSKSVKHYTNCKCLIIGKSNHVTGPFLWKLGLYIPFFEKSFEIEANGEVGERLHVIVFGGEFGTFISYEHIRLEIFKAKGIFFWGKQSIFLKEPWILAYVKAKNLDVYY